jgi:hypothetical protein
MKYPRLCRGDGYVSGGRNAGRKCVFAVEIKQQVIIWTTDFLRLQRRCLKCRKFMPYRQERFWIQGETPTVEVDVMLDSGVLGGLPCPRARLPAQGKPWSFGYKDKDRFGGKGVRTAVHNVGKIIARS